MPRICEFYGIVIAMFYNDHAPPHFHVVYNEYQALVGIDPIRVLEGPLTQRTRSLIFEWAALHQSELRQNWQLAQEHRPLSRIEPLE